MSTLRADVLAEIKQARETRERQAFEGRVERSVNTFNRRLMHLETASRHPVPTLNESLMTEIGAVLRNHVAQQVGMLKNEIAALGNRIKHLEEGPSLRYRGVYQPGETYARNSLVTWDGSLWIAQSSTGSAPGNPSGSHWKLVCKRGKDGKDGKDWRNEKGWPTS